MVKIAHASSAEKAKTKMKKIRAQRATDRQKENLKISSMKEDEKQEYLEKKNKISLDTQVSNFLWDFKSKQFPRSKKDLAIPLLREKLSILKGEGLAFHEKKINEIEAMLDAITQW